MISNYRDKPSNKVYTLEDEFKVDKFHMMIDEGDGVSQRCVSFFARHGGQRTVPIADIVDIR